jgi:hypothetical protein
VVGNDDPELVHLVQALLKAVHSGGQVDVRVGRGPVIRVSAEDVVTGQRLLAVATGVAPPLARALEVEGWVAIEHRSFRSAGFAGGGRSPRTRWRAGDTPEVLVDDVSRTWPVVADPDVDAAAIDVLEAAYVLAGPEAIGPASAHHVALGSEDAQLVAMGAIIGGTATIAATLLAAVLRVLAAYPLDWLGSLVIPLVLGAATSFVASRAVLLGFARVRSLRPQAEPTAIVVGALAPALAIVGYTAAAIRLGLP